MKIIQYTFAVTLLLFLSSAGFAQEKQVPFFPEQEVVTIDKNYAKKMSFFTEYKDFVEAKLFLTPESTYAIEIFYEMNDTLFKDRKVLTLQQKNAYLDDLLRIYAGQLRAETGTETVSPDDLTRNENLLLNQKGRTAMLVMNTIAGLGYYGIAMPITFNVEDTKVVVGLYMLAAGASFYVPYKITERRNVTMAQASLNFYGISRGVMHGMFLGELMAKDPNYDDYFGDLDYNDYNNAAFQRAQERFDAARDRHTSTLFGVGMLGSIGGGIAGFNLAKRWEYDGGSTSIFQMWGDVGTISGLLLSDVFDFYDRHELDAAFATTIAASFIGMTGGKFFGDSRNYTLGDAIVYRSAIAMTTLPLITLVDYFNPNDETAYTVAGLTGLAAGGFLGWRATNNLDFSTSDAVYVALGELAGGLLGVGVGYLVAPDFESEIILTSATLGALGGYGLMYGRLKHNAVPLRSDINLDLKINPAGLMMNRMNVKVSPAMAGVYNFGSLSVRW